MVKLPGPFDQPAREVGPRERAQRNFRQWGSRWHGRQREHVRIGEPTSLHELEELAWRSVDIMDKYESNKTKPTEEKFQKAMELLRVQYNMSFIVLCRKCGMRHNTEDEIMAPER